MRQDGKTFFKVTVEFSVENDKGQVKTKNYDYLVLDSGVTEAEAKITDILSKDGGMSDFKVKNVVSTKFVKSIE